MDSKTSGFGVLHSFLTMHRVRSMATKLALAVLAAALAISATAPAFAGKPHQSRPGGHHEQAQAPEVSTAKKGKGSNNQKKSVKKTFSNNVRNKGNGKKKR